MNNNKKQISPMLLVGALAMAEVTCAVESNMIFAALSTLYQTYGDPAKVGWLVTAFLLTSAGAAAIGGRLGDIFGRKRVLLYTLLIALAGSLLALFGPSLGWVIAGRALQGMTMTILPLCYGLLKEHLPQEKVALGVGMLAGTYTIGAGIGWIGGGIVVDHGEWQDIFIYSSVLAVMAMLLVWLLVPNSPAAGRKGPLDVWGGLLFVPGVTLVLLGFTFIKSWGWSDWGVWALIVAGLLVLAGWVRHELGQREPLINVRLLGNRQVGLANLTFAMFGMGPLVYSTVFFPLLQQPVSTGVGLGLSASVTGMLQIPGIAASALAAILGGMLAARRGPRLVLLLGACVQGMGFLVLMLAHSVLWQVIALLVIITASMNMVFTSVPALILDAVPEERASEATGLAQVVRSVAMAIGAQVVALLLASQTVTEPTSGASFPAASAFVAALGYLTLTAFLLVPLALAMPQRKREVSRLPAAAVVPPQR